MLRGWVDLQFVGDPLRLLRFEGGVQRGGGMDVQIVEDQDDLLRIGVVDIDQVLDAVRMLCAQSGLRR